MRGLAEVTDQQLKSLALQAANEAVSAYRNSQKQTTKSDYAKMRRNTKLVLENYHYLEDHINAGLPAITDADFKYSSVIPKDQLSIYSLMGYHARSIRMIKHITNMLKFYKYECQHSNDERLRRRYPVINGLYLQRPTRTRADLAVDLVVDRKTIDRDAHQAVRDLSVMFWGADAIDDLSE